VAFFCWLSITISTGSEYICSSWGIAFFPALFLGGRGREEVKEGGEVRGGGGGGDSNLGGRDVSERKPTMEWGREGDMGRAESGWGGGGAGPGGAGREEDISSRLLLVRSCMEEWLVVIGWGRGLSLFPLGLKFWVCHDENRLNQHLEKKSVVQPTRHTGREREEGMHMSCVRA
jgi:hypothetical protein